jgi:hypothetical protein
MPRETALRSTHGRIDSPGSTVGQTAENSRNNSNTCVVWQPLRPCLSFVLRCGRCVDMSGRGYPFYALGVPYAILKGPSTVKGKPMATAVDVLARMRGRNQLRQMLGPQLLVWDRGMQDGFISPLVAGRTSLTRISNSAWEPARGSLKSATMTSWRTSRTRNWTKLFWRISR